jgi:AbrB family looped-hinge helix DNA binding protein
MIQAKLSSKFQLAIPKAIREVMQLKAGQQFTLITRGNIIELIPIIPVQDARGMLTGCQCSDSSEYRDRQERSQ